MTVAITLDVLPARFGDCLFIECAREGMPPWRCVVDGGPTDCWPFLRKRLLQLPEDDRNLDLVVVTHIDADHIAGALRFFDERESIPGLGIGDVWFNGLPQLPESEGDQVTRSVRQGEDLVELLLGGAPASSLTSSRRTRGALPWNKAFGGGPVVTGGPGEFKVYEADDWPKITLLSPTLKRLVILRRKWIKEMQALRGGESEQVEPEPPLPPLEHLDRLAVIETDDDTTAANGSSIAFLLEHRGASLLLTGDAFPNVLGKALQTLAKARNVTGLEIDAFKLPHHGSKGNVTRTLISLALAKDYVVSSNGDTFHHPDDVALARVVTVAAGTSPRLWFNYSNDRTCRWSEPGLQAEWCFTTSYPADDSAGVRLELPERPPP